MIQFSLYGLRRGEPWSRRMGLKTANFQFCSPKSRINGDDKWEKKRRQSHSHRITTNQIYEISLVTKGVWYDEEVYQKMAVPWSHLGSYTTGSYQWRTVICGSEKMVEQFSIIYVLNRCAWKIIKMTLRFLLPTIHYILCE